MDTIGIRKNFFQGEAIENTSESENLQADQLVSNKGNIIEIECDLPSVSGKINLSRRQRSIIGSCFDEEFLL